MELTPATVVNNFPMYCDALVYARYLARYELFKRILEVEGNIIECGVGWGGGLMSWATMAFIFEPHAATRRIYGFDVFDSNEPFPSASEKDGTIPEQPFNSDYDHLNGIIREFSKNYYQGAIRTYLVKGDACQTIPEWCRDKPHALVALLYLDFDVFMPTQTALSYLVPRMPSGGIIAFDECNWGKWPGETIALLETLGVRNVKLRRFSWCQSLAYCEV